MASCPTTPGHRCLECAPPTRGRPVSREGLHPGNPLTPRDPSPVTQDTAAFDAHWAGVTVTRSNPTFDGATPNHDHWVVIPEPAKKAKAAARTTKPKTPKLAIPVTYNF
jgi:hypothetical protein